MLEPRNSAELAEVLLDAAAHQRTITLAGNGSKAQMAGPLEPSDVTITTSAMRRIIQYEPQDLTISVDAGMPWKEFSAAIGDHNQMVPLDPPFADHATVGGIIASNGSGPRRRLYGSARDLVIGMTFATLEGKLVRSGGMVVKNVAGLDMAKLMIGSFGTLAAIASVNFKLLPAPEADRSFALPFPSCIDATTVRDRILTSALQPSAIDLFNPGAAESLDCGNRWVLAVRAGGSESALRRYEAELAQMAGRLAVETEFPANLWQQVESFTPRYLVRQTDGAVIRVSCTLKEVATVMESFPGPAVARAASGVCYGYLDHIDAAPGWFARAKSNGWKAVVEFAPESRKRAFELWPSPGGDFEIMQRVKNLFDPSNLLNRGRLYRRL